VAGADTHPLSQVNVSPLCGVRWVASVYQVHKRLRVNTTVDECEPLPRGMYGGLPGFTEIPGSDVRDLAGDALAGEAAIMMRRAAAALFSGVRAGVPGMPGGGRGVPGDPSAPRGVRGVPGVPGALAWVVCCGVLVGVSCGVINRPS